MISLNVRTMGEQEYIALDFKNDLTPTGLAQLRRSAVLNNYLV